MQLSECLSIGVKELLANKVRSCLSVLGIIIGVISLVIMMAIMTGIEQTWLTHINALGGLRKATISSITPVVDGLDREDLKKDLTLEDAYLVKRQTALIQYVSAEADNFVSIGADGSYTNYKQIIGGTRDVLKVNGQSLDKGRPITDEDVRRSRKVCVIGTTIRDEMFGPNTNPVGETMVLNNELYEVVGLLKKNSLIRQKKNVLEQRNSLIYVPVTTLRDYSGEMIKISKIIYMVRNRRDISRAQREMKLLVDKNHRSVGDIEVKTEEERYLQSKKSLLRMKIGFSIIAGISLIVGGIGIMNIMIASVIQRVREVGVRKSVGAKPRDIFLQFLMESALVSGLGGLIGILGSFLTVFIMNIFSSEFNPIISPQAAFLAALFSIIVGVCFGLYPAIKASKLDPIEALRYQ